MADIDLSVAIQAPDGWHQLEDEANGYEVHMDAFASRATPRRDTEVAGTWIDGTYVTRSTRDNVVETVVIIVTGSTAHEYSTRMEALKGWFDQINYQLKVHFGNVMETWSCPRPGQYTEETAQALRVATTGVLRVQVARLPKMLVEAV